MLAAFELISLETLSPIVVTVLSCFIDYYEEIVPYILSLSLDHHSLPEKSARSRIDGCHFGVYRPIDSNALLFYAWMMSGG